MGAQQDPYAAIAQPAAASDPYAAIAKAGTPPSAGSRFLSGVESGAGVVSDQQGKDFFRHPIDTAGSMLEAQGALGKRAAGEFKGGDYKRAIAHGVEYLLPGIGPTLAHAGDQLESGDIAGGVGTTVGAALPIVAGSPEARAVPGRIGPPVVRAVARGTNAALSKAPEVIGAGAGALIGREVGAPGIGAAIGYGAGKVLPKLRVPGENFRIPKPLSVEPEGTYPGANLPEHPGEFPGAHLPETPPREVLQARPLAEGGGKPTPPPQSAALGRIARPSPEPVAATPEAIPTGETVPAEPPPIAGTGPGAGRVSAKPEPAATPIAKSTAKPSPIRVQSEIERGLGNEPVKIKPGVKIKDQFKPIEMPEGHSAVDSSALHSFKYDPATREFEAFPKSGNTIYVYGDVSPEVAERFANAESKGAAWKALRDTPGVTQVAKIINGKRMSTVPGILRTEGGASIAKSAAGMNDLRPLLEESLRQLRARP